MDTEKLLEIGGREWKSDSGHHRIYFNDLHELVGLRILERFKTGNIFRAELDGEKCSNNAARRIVDQYFYSKLWYDVTTNTWGWKDLHDGTAKQMVAAIEAKLQ